MSEIKAGLRYTKEHEWIEKLDDGIGKVGMSDHAQHEMTEIVYVELPEVGKKVKKGDVIGVVESVKTVSDVYSPASGEVIEVNEDLEGSPQSINESPYGEGWMAIIRLEDEAELEELMDSDAYTEYLKE
jgi:glycine cleavage system H protein